MSLFSLAEIIPMGRNIEAIIFELGNMKQYACPQTGAPL